MRWTLALVAAGCEAGSSEPSWDGEPAPTEVGAPLGPVVSQVVGPDGGSVTSDDGELVLTVPVGALTDDVELTVQRVENLAWGGVGDAYRTGPAVAFAVPATLAFGFDDPEVANAWALDVATQGADGYWTSELEPGIDDQGRITVQVDSLGAPADPRARTSGAPSPAGPDRALYTRLRVSPPEATIKHGARQKVEVDACQQLDTSGWPTEPDLRLGSCVRLTMPSTGFDGERPHVVWNVTGRGAVQGTDTRATFVAPAAGGPEDSLVIADLKFPHKLGFSWYGDDGYTGRAHIHIEDEGDWVGTATVTDPLFTIAAQATWTFESSGPDGAHYVPSGEVTVAVAVESECTVRPLSHEITAEDGYLVVDSSVDPPTYAGIANSVWVVDIDCPNTHRSQPIGAPWFGDGSTAPLGVVTTTADGVDVIDGRAQIGADLMTWHFER
jgi:hypothetical protein